MRHILAKAHRSVLEQFAWSRVLVAFDFDGTLAPIVREPSAAKMRASTAALFEALAKVYPTAVISGRARADVAKRVRCARLVQVVGNQGAEWADASDTEVARLERRFRAVIKQWSRQLEAALDGAQGVEVEDKGLSIAVHYRKSRRRKEARAAVLESVDALKGPLRVLGGKLAFNLMPQGAPHKGIAVQRLRAAQRADTAIYVGDDATDEDVFGLDEPGRLLSIRVGRSAWSAAHYYVRDQSEVDELLRFLLVHRPAARSAGARVTLERAR